MRVYLAPETFLPLVGGSERQAFSHSRYLRAQGIEATIFTLHFQCASPAYECMEGVPVIRVARRILIWHDHFSGYLRRLCYLLALLLFGWRLWRHRHAYDMLHVFQLSLFTLPALVVCRLTGKPLIVAMRCDSPMLRREHPSLSHEHLDGLARLGRLGIRFIAYQLRLAHARIVVLSSHMRDGLICSGFAAEYIHLIPNGVDIQAFSVPEERREGTLTVVCVAKLRYQKGIDILLRAWRLLVDILPGARLILVGDGPSEASLRLLANELDIAESVEFAGLCTDVAMQYQRGMVTVLPSRWKGMPNALLEAMACGRACVATRVSGSEDILCGEEHGLLVEPGDEDSLASALWLLLTESELALRCGRKARKHIEQHYTLEMSMGSCIALYRELLHEGSSMECVELSLTGTN